MNRLSFKLAAVLGLQLVLALILWAGGPDYTAFKAKEPLLSFDPAKVDRIEIAESSANRRACERGRKMGYPILRRFPCRWREGERAAHQAGGPEEGLAGRLLGGSRQALQSHR